MVSHIGFYGIFSRAEIHCLVKTVFAVCPAALEFCEIVHNLFRFVTKSKHARIRRDHAPVACAPQCELSQSVSAVLVICVFVKSVISALAYAPESVAFSRYKSPYRSLSARRDKRVVYVFKEKLRHKVFKCRTRPGRQSVAEKSDLHSRHASPKGAVARPATRYIASQSCLACQKIVMPFKPLCNCIVADIKLIFDFVDERGKIRFVNNFFTAFGCREKTVVLAELFADNDRGNKVSAVYRRNKVRIYGFFECNVIPIVQVSFPFIQLFAVVQYPAYFGVRPVHAYNSDLGGANMRQYSIAEVCRRGSAALSFGRKNLYVVAREIFSRNLLKVAVSCRSVFFKNGGIVF